VHTVACLVKAMSPTALTAVPCEHSQHVDGA